MVDNAFRVASDKVSEAVPEGGGQQAGQRPDLQNSPAPSEDPLNLNEIQVVAPVGLEPT